MTIKDMKEVGVICLVAGFCVFHGAQGTAHAASFDCKKAKAPIEIAICVDKDISALDEQLASKYKALLKTLDEAGKGVVKKEQKYWLKNIRGHAMVENGPRWTWTDTQQGDVVSLKTRYQKRLQDLELKKKMVEGGYRMLSGVYVIPTECIAPIQDYVPAAAVDELKLEFKTDKLAVSIRSIGGSCNICSLEGIAEKQPDGAYLLTEQDCRMTFAVKDRKIMVSEKDCEIILRRGSGIFPRSFRSSASPAENDREGAGPQRLRRRLISNGSNLLEEKHPMKVKIVAACMTALLLLSGPQASSAADLKEAGGKLWRIVSGKNARDQKDVTDLLEKWLAAQNSGNFGVYESCYAARFQGVRRTGTSRCASTGPVAAGPGRMFKKPMTVQMDGVEIVLKPSSAVVASRRPGRRARTRTWGRRRWWFRRKGRPGRSPARSCCGRTWCPGGKGRSTAYGGGAVLLCGSWAQRCT